MVSRAPVSRRSVPPPLGGPGPRTVSGQGRPRPVRRRRARAPSPSHRSSVATTSRQSRQRLLAAGAALVAVVALRAMTAIAATGGSPRRMTVRPGETLWQLSERFAPGEDPRRWIFDVEKMNGLAHAALYPGQVLRLPPR